MKCFVVTKKHIIAAVVIAVSVPVTLISAKLYSSCSVPAFKSQDIINEVIPASDKPAILKKLETVIDKSRSLKPSEVLNKYSPLFEKEEEIIPTAEPTEKPTQTPIASPQAIEQKKIKESIAEIKNETKYIVDTSEYADENYSFPDGGAVLIIHTHTTECYAPENSKTAIDNSRNVDETKNMIAVGEVFREVLEEKGIKVIHDKTIHDYPSYQGAYGRSLTTAKKNIEKNSDIAVVLDIHRDAIIKEDGTRIKLSADIKGEECAQLMVVCGTDGTGLSHSGWRNNLNFGIKITEAAESLAPGIMRPINLREERFNQHLTDGSLIIEVGTNGNTLTEAKRGAKYMAEAIAQVIKQG